MSVESAVFGLLRTLAKRAWAVRVMDRALKPFNPFSTTRSEKPYPLYEQIHAHGYVTHAKVLRSWIVSGYDECEQVLRAPTSVDRSAMMSALKPYNQLKPASLELFTQTMLLRDPPVHTRLRRIVNRAFTPRAVAGLEPSIEKITRDLLHDLDAERHADVQEAFCDQLPIFAISDMLGLPRSEWDRFKRISDTFVQFVDPINPFDPVEMERTIAEFRTIIDGLVDDRRRQPQDDMLTRLIEAEDEGDRLDHGELVSMVALLMVAGHETTSGLLGNALIAFDRFPDQAELLRAQPELADNAIEELLRYDSPVQNTDRFPLDAVQVGGHEIPKNASIFVILGAANRDERRYDAPHELRIDRTDPRALSFGHGIHHCLGAALARLEATVALPLFLETFPGYTVDHEQMQWKRSITTRGPKHLPMALHS